MPIYEKEGREVAVINRAVWLMSMTYKILEKLIRKQIEYVLIGTSY